MEAPPKVEDRDRLGRESTDDPLQISCMRGREKKRRRKVRHVMVAAAAQNAWQLSGVIRQSASFPECFLAAVAIKEEGEEGLLLLFCEASGKCAKGR